MCVMTLLDLSLWSVLEGSLERRSSESEVMRVALIQRLAPAQFLFPPHPCSVQQSN